MFSHWSQLPALHQRSSSWAIAKSLHGLYQSSKQSGHCQEQANLSCMLMVFPQFDLSITNHPPGLQSETCGGLWTSPRHTSVMDSTVYLSGEYVSIWLKLDCDLGSFCAACCPADPVYQVLAIPELLHHILSDLRYLDLCSAATVCRGWNEIASDLLWREVWSLKTLLRIYSPLQLVDPGQPAGPWVRCATRDLSYRLLMPFLGSGVLDNRQ